MSDAKAIAGHGKSKIMRSCYFLFFFFLFSNIISFSQEAKSDSLHAAISRSREDTSKIILILRLGELNELKNPKKALSLFNEALRLSSLLSSAKHEVASLINIGITYYSMGNWDSALFSYSKALKISRAYDVKSKIGTILTNTGNVHQRLSNFPEALKYYQEAEPYLALREQAVLVSNMTDLFDRIGNVKASRAYGYRAIKIAEQLKDTIIWIDAHINLFSSKQDTLLGKGKQLLFRVLPHAKRLNLTDKVISIYHNLGLYYYFKDQYDSALFYADKCSENFVWPFNTDRNLAHNNALKANIYLYSRNFKEARKYALQGRDYAIKSKIIFLTKSINRALAQAEEQLGNYQAAVEAYKNFIILNDSTNEMRNAEIVDLMEARYQNEKKQKEIKELELIKIQNEERIKFRNSIIVLSFLGIGLLLFVGALLFRNFKNRQELIEKDVKIKQFKIVELEKDKQLFLANAIVKGQEDERTRVAKDLHDGLGSMLSGIKMSLSNMKGNKVMTNDSVLVFERSLNMLDNSIRELKRVAHNLMPEALIKFGLTASLKDFTDFINQSNVLKAIFQQVGEQRRLEASIELAVYRLANELINNALRHSSATELIIQLHYESDSLMLTVQDNGRGFDQQILRQTTGSGWPNIRSRVEYLNGTIDVDTKPGDGTGVTVRVPI